MKAKKDLIRDPESSQLNAKWLDETNTTSAREIYSYLMAAVGPKCPIGNVTKELWKAAACCGWSAYIVALSNRPKHTPMTDDEQMELWLG